MKQFQSAKLASLGDVAINIDTNDTLIFDGLKWVPSSQHHSKKHRLLDDLKDEKMEDIVDTLVTVLIQAGIIKDVDDFKELISANKLANDLSKT